MRPSLLQTLVVALALLPAAGVLLAGGGPVAVALALALGPIAAGGGWALAHRTIASRLEQLAEAADALAAGDLSVRERLRRGGLGRAGRGLETLAVRVEELSRREALLEGSGQAIVGVDAAGRVTFANAAAGALLGDDPLALQGRSVHDVVHRDGTHAAAACPLLRPAHDGRTRRGEDAFARAGGDSVAVEYAVSPVVAGGRPAGIAIAFHDVAERQRTEERLRHADRMEAVAQLAAGVAHDFNNLLAVILSCASALRRELPDGEGRRDADEIARAAQRGATLVRQLLDFGRRSPDGAKLVEPNALVLSIEGMLRRAAGERVRLTFALGPEAGRVRVDPGRLEQALLALVLNARDAQPEGGAVEISTAVVEADGGAPGPRRWVAVAVRDHGPGLGSEAKGRLFEPFFAAGDARGGISLATVYAFARQFGGEVDVEAAPGGGTVVRLLLPEVKESDRGVPAPAGWSGLRGRETVLVLDGDVALRSFARELLAELGYSVLEAAAPAEAAALARDHGGPIHLLVLHVPPPGDEALELATALRRRRPEMAVLYASEPSASPALARARIPHAATVARPYEPEELLARVRAVLGGTSG
jgi:PAS domain S-box-containing protein